MNQLITLLQNQQAEYDIIQHEAPIQTAQQGAALFGIEIGQTSPTLILKSETGYYALILSGDYGRVDFEPLKSLLGVNELRMAKPKEVEQTTGYAVGSVPMIGHGLPAIVDRGMHRYADVYGGTGNPNATLRIRPSDVERLNDVIAYIR